MHYENAHTAKLFRSTRERQKLTVRRMAQLLRVSSSTLNRIEDGHTAPKRRVVEQLLALNGANGADEGNLKDLFVQAFL